MRSPSAAWQLQDSSEIDPDLDILTRVVAGEGEAFSVLVERHQTRLLRLAERMLGDVEEARDAVQEVFLKAFRGAAGFKPRGGVFTWLYRIAVNHCLNRLRRRRLVSFLRFERDQGDDAPAFEPADERPDVLASLEARRRWRATRRAIERLPANQRAVLVLARFEEMSYKEIAETLGITLGAVESRLFRAIRNLETAQEGEVSRVPAPGERNRGERR